MPDSCYLCKRTQADLDHLIEEIRTRRYLSYFSEARSQMDDQQRKFTFLQRLKDEEGSDPHFRINAKQVFGDPMAYKKLMPWIETLIEVVHSTGTPVDERQTIGELVDDLLVQERSIANRMEQALNQLRTAFTAGGTSPLTLDAVTLAFPVTWSVEGLPFTWEPAAAKNPRSPPGPPGASKPFVEISVYLCTICQRIVERTGVTPTASGQSPPHVPPSNSLG